MVSFLVRLSVVVLCLALCSTVPCLAGDQPNCTNPCGVASLTNMLWLATGNPDPLNSAETGYLSSQSEMSLRDIRDSAKRLGLVLVGIEADLAELAGLGYPAIVQVDGNHFLVVDQITASYAYVLDGKASSVLAIKDLRKRYGGFALVPSEAVSDRSTFARVWVDEPIVDVGRVAKNTDFSQTFVIRTTSTEPIRIGDLRACCGATFTGEPGQELSADKPLKVTVNYQSPSIGASLYKSVSLSLLRSRWPVVDLSIVGTLVGETMVTPAGVDFGNVAKGSSSEQTLILRNIDAARVENIRFATSLPAITVRKGDYDAAKNQLTLRVRLSACTVRGQMAERVSVMLGPGNAGPTLQIPVLGNIQWPVSVVPGKLMLGLIRRGKAGSARVAVQRADHKPISILEAKPPPGVSVDYSRGEGTWIVEARMSPTDVTGSVDGYVTLVTDCADDSNIRIPISAYVEK